MVATSGGSLAGLFRSLFRLLDPPRFPRDDLAEPGPHHAGPATFLSSVSAAGIPLVRSFPSPIRARLLAAVIYIIRASSDHGLYEHAPSLAVCLLLTGLASVGFPGTVGFVATDLLVDGAIKANLYVGLAVIAAALNSIAVLRAYFLLFTGTRHVLSVSLRIVARERFAVLTLAGLILGGGLYPQLGVSTRQQAAEEILEGSQLRSRRTVPADHREKLAGEIVDRR